MYLNYTILYISNMTTFYREQDRFEALLYQKFYRMLKVKKSEKFQKSFIKFQICVRAKTNI